MEPGALFLPAMFKAGLEFLHERRPLALLLGRESFLQEGEDGGFFGL